jgi:thymidine phosphorylase
VAAHRAPILAPRRGVISQIDNRLISRIAKLAGAPRAQAAGIELHVRVGHVVERGQPFMTVHAESPGELAYALAYHRRHAHVFGLHDA